jgi:hypothetical protein
MNMGGEQQRDWESGQTVDALRQQRMEVEGLARSLKQQANQQWRKAVEGIVALPAAIAVATAASTLYFVGFVTRGLEVFQQQAEEGARQMQASRDERGDGNRRLREREERNREERGEGGRGESGRPELPVPRA